MTAAAREHSLREFVIDVAFRTAPEPPRPVSRLTPEQKAAEDPPPY
jgi:hypothetical protein